MIKNIRGIEGDDLPFHLKLLGYDANLIPNRYQFYPLNDHYNSHTKGWQEEQTQLVKSAEVVVFYDLVNTSDHEHLKFKKFISEFSHHNKVYLTVNQADFSLADVTIIPWDFMWNRIKAYYTEPILENVHLHHYAGRDAYRLTDLTLKPWVKIMSLCGRDYGYRNKLYQVVKQYAGYISNRSKGVYLEESPVLGAYNPVPNKFYETSCLSVYVESNCIQTDLLHITEKTFEPLIKGHFILPFSNPGTITRLRTMGFQFPDFIDYEYDLELDHNVRFEKLCNELQRIMAMDLLALHQKYIDMLKYNQQLIVSLPYDSRILKVFDV